jgi:O-acetyl-ADP-ribose deacetylase (regulator of RNase III)
MLRAAVSGALDAARAIDARTIAFPAISAGIYGYPVPEATAVLASEVVRWLDANPGAVAEAVLVALDGAVADLFRSGVAGAISPNGWSFDTTWSRPLR